ncbi:cupin domain-containing protein [uncultured Tateyamaria sp.]|uniref:cupin domain-containing protein n=1 Tax=uncultured Tateyamaria sp. TaxID=455651 RepID=UPI0026373B19|nr:cupin domain-containing protein [uncultured Tateyamaria sp.]
MSGAVHTPAGGGAANDAFGLTRRFHVDGDATLPAVFEEDVPHGAGPPRHIHNAATELFVILRGRVLFEADGETLEAGPGDTVFIPPGVVHAFKGLAPEGSVVLITLTPGSGADLFRRVAAEGLKAPDDMPRIAEIAAQTDLTFVGPPL